MVILSFAGRCSADPLCTPPFDNDGYLDEATRGTVQAVAAAFAAQGLAVGYFDGAGRLRRGPSRKTLAQGSGYL